MSEPIGVRRRIRDLQDEVVELRRQRHLVSQRAARTRDTAELEAISSEVVRLGQAIATIKDKIREASDEGQHRRLAAFARHARRRFGDEACNAVWEEVEREMTNEKPSAVGAALPMRGGGGGVRRRVEEVMR